MYTRARAHTLRGPVPAARARPSKSPRGRRCRRPPVRVCAVHARVRTCSIVHVRACLIDEASDFGLVLALQRAQLIALQCTNTCTDMCARSPPPCHTPAMLFASAYTFTYTAHRPEAQTGSVPPCISVASCKHARGGRRCGIDAHSCTCFELRSCSNFSATSSLLLGARACFATLSPTVAVSGVLTPAARPILVVFAALFSLAGTH